MVVRPAKRMMRQAMMMMMMKMKMMMMMMMMMMTVTGAAPGYQTK
jgi:hypothetical protein